MAEEQGKGIQQIEGCEVIYDMGSGLVIAKVPLDKVKEQDINARIMKNEMQDQLTANIKKRGQLESLPLFVLVDGKLEIISGHHRVKSARAAEMKEIIAIVDVSGLSRSKIAAKQLAHNAISGFDDDSTLRELFAMACGAYLDIIAETFNSQGIPNLIDINGDHFAGITDYPKLTHGDIEDADIAKVSAFVKDMVGIGVLVPDDGLEDYIRQIGKLPERTDDTRELSQTSQNGRKF